MYRLQRVIPCSAADTEDTDRSRVRSAPALGRKTYQVMVSPLRPPQQSELAPSRRLRGKESGVALAGAACSLQARRSTWDDAVTGGSEGRCGHRRVLFFGSQIKARPCFWKPNQGDFLFLIAKSRWFLFIGREINAPPFSGALRFLVGGLVF